MKPKDDIINFNIDGRPAEGHAGQGLVEAARGNGVYIPTLCYFNHIDPPLGTCRICTVKIDGRQTAACQAHVHEGMEVEVNSKDLIDQREAIIEMLFSEGNHFCPACEKSGDCSLQTLGYEMSIAVSRFPHVFSNREIDFNAKHLLLDHNRCVLCKRCVEDVKTMDGKRVFYFKNRGHHTLVGIDYEQEAKLTEEQAVMAMNCCPVGAILLKGKSVGKPFGDRKYDKFPISQDVPGRDPSYEKPVEKKKKKTIATTSLAGCFGCHMSMLDIDLEILDLLDQVEIRKSPLTDYKHFDEPCDVGIIEGGCCNSENVEVLKLFRENCKILISVGECAIYGGLPAMRNFISLKECLDEAFFDSETSDGSGLIPEHEDLPKLLNKVIPCHEVVKIDYFIPGCPPSANHIWKVIRNVLFNEEYSIAYTEFKYD
jgi:[NiFe] hydrogenase diaphorase moiety small subunit